MPPKKIPRPEKGQTLLQFSFTGNSNKSEENESSDTGEQPAEIMNRQNGDAGP